MRVLVTGASGFIGSEIVKRLCVQGNDIFGISRSLQSDDSIVKWIQHDLIKDPVSSLRLPEKIDVVYHLSGQTSTYAAKDDPIADLNSNVIALLNLLEYFKSVKQIPFVTLAGTATEVGLVDVLPISEETKDSPITFYDASKLTAEMYLKQYVREGWVRGCTLRLANAYGRSLKGQKKDRGILDKVFTQAMGKHNITIFGDGEYIRDYVFIDDVVAAFLLTSQFSEKTNGLTFYIGTGNGISLKEAFQKVISLAGDVTGKQVNIEHVIPPKNLSDIEFRNAVVDSTSFSKATGWSAKYSFETGLEAAYQSYFVK